MMKFNRDNRMVSINGEIKLYPRIALNNFCDPNNVYDLSNMDLKKGIKKIKGVRKATINNVFVPFGVNGFYYKLSNDIGIKVFYSFVNFKKTSNCVSKEFRNIKKCYNLGLSINAIEIKDVELDFNGDIDGHIITKGIITNHLDVPNVIDDFAIGKYYDFNCLDEIEHPLHNVDGFKIFRQHVIDVARKNNLKNICTKLGDIIYCIRNKRWFLVDCGGIK